MPSDSRILITGGAGFIGSALTRHLTLKERRTVTVLDKLTYAGSKLNFGQASDSEYLTFVKGDVCDGLLLKDLLAGVRPTIIFHLAAESHVDRSINDSSPFIQSNIVGTATLIEAARKYWEALTPSSKSEFRLIHVSTDEVYGSLALEGYFTEESLYRPNSPYAASKASADHLVRAWHKTYGLPTVTTNCSNNYGPYQLAEKLIPRTIQKALEGRPIPIYGNGQQIRDWLFVEDHVSGLLLAAENGQPGETYCFGGSSDLNNLTVAEKICDSIDAITPNKSPRRQLIKFVRDRPGHDFRYALNSEKAEIELSWRRQMPFEIGLSRTIDWYVENTDWSQD